MAYYTDEELKALGLGACGSNVKLSTRASLYNATNIRIGDNVRIDDYCVLSAGVGGIDIGNFVHVGVFVSLIGAGRIYLQDFCGLSARVCVYSSSDDYGGAHLTNPNVPVEFTNVTHADVIIGRHAIIGAGSVILPGMTLEDGAAVGALTLVTKPCGAFGIYFGTPARRIGNRKQTLLELERQFLGRLDSAKPPA